ncbi:zinc-binding dehydrogenase, partial [Micromonospora sp. NPDC057141]
RGRGARVLLVEPDPFRRSVAAGIGIDAVDPGATDVPALVDERTAGAGADVAFEVSGSAAGVTTAVDVLTTRGRLVMVAIHPQPRPVNLHRFFWRELELLGARLYQREDMVEAVRLVASGAIPARQLISRVVPADAVTAAFTALEEGGGVMKVLLDWQEESR